MVTAVRISQAGSPGGSTRFGISSQDAVVDRDLRLFRVPNASVIATSIMPTGGGANPMMMVMMLALRYVDRILEPVDIRHLLSRLWRERLG
jgi:choline dehydrogenase-like flavoprotein